MDRNDLINEIKKLLKEEFDLYRGSLESKIPPEQRQQFTLAKSAGTEFIKKNPWISASVAVVAGFALARLLYKQRAAK